MAIKLNVNHKKGNLCIDDNITAVLQYRCFVRNKKSYMKQKYGYATYMIDSLLFLRQWWSVR